MESTIMGLCRVQGSVLGFGFCFGVQGEDSGFPHRMLYHTKDPYMSSYTTEAPSKRPYHSSGSGAQKNT